MSRRNSPTEQNPQNANRIAAGRSAVEKSDRAKNDPANKPRPASRKKLLTKRPRRTNRTHIGIRSRTGSGAKSTNRRTSGATLEIGEEVAAEGRLGVVAAAAEDVANADRVGANQAGGVRNAVNGPAAESLVPKHPAQSNKTKKELGRNDRLRKYVARNVHRTARKVNDRRQDLDREADDRRVGTGQEAIATRGAASDPDRKAREARGVHPSEGRNVLRDRNLHALLRKRRMSRTTLEPDCSTRAAHRNSSRPSVAKDTANRAIAIRLVMIGTSHPSRTSASLAAVLKPARNAQRAMSSRKAKRPTRRVPNDRRRKADARLAGGVAGDVHVRDEIDPRDRWIGRAL
jgi:hypothetical protein